MATILVIDDDKAVQDTIRRILESVGFVVVEADNGRTGIELFGPLKPDVVITDMLMPERDGVETIREIRRLDPAARIIAISGGTGPLTSDYLLPVARTFGALRVVAKPFRRAELISAVEECLAV